MFTPTETRILRLLADGEPHRREEVLACLPDELGPISNIRYHLSRARKKLRPQGRDVLCVLHERRVCYRLVALLPPADGGATLP